MLACDLSNTEPYQLCSSLTRCQDHCSDHQLKNKIRTNSSTCINLNLKVNLIKPILTQKDKDFILFPDSVAYIFIILISSCTSVQCHHFLNKYDDYSHFLNHSTQLYLICCPEKRPFGLISALNHCAPGLCPHSELHQQIFIFVFSKTRRIK